jgi:hypothetical protein
MTSPLLFTDPDALTKLFDADPLTLDDAQIMQLITELRRRRSVFASEEAAKTLAGKSKRAKTEAPKDAEGAALADKPTSEVSLDDI